MENEIFDIQNAKSVLLFRDDHKSNLNLKNAYKEILCVQFQESLFLIKELMPKAYNELNAKLNLISDIELRRILLIPEVSYFVIKSKFIQVENLFKFYLKTVDAELAKKNKFFNPDNYKYLWTSNGDFFITFQKDKNLYEEFIANKIENKIVLDFFSPFCLKVSQDEFMSLNNELSLNEFDYKESLKISSIIHNTITKITGKDIKNFILEFTEVIVFQKSSMVKGERTFYSASESNFIGQITLINPDIIPIERLAEALIHESIHSYLYILDSCKTWMPSGNLTGLLGNKFISPWSGRALNLRNFLHAIFVWFGIYNFWQLMLNTSKFKKEFIIGRLDLISKGFKKLNIVEIDRINNINISPNAIEAIINIQNFFLIS